MMLLDARHPNEKISKNYESELTITEIKSELNENYLLKVSLYI